MSLLGKYYKPQSNQSSYRDWLNSDDLTDKGTVFVIDELRESQGNMKCDMLLDVTAGKKEYTLALYGDSVLTSQLVDVLGENERKWTGKKIKLYVAKGKYINAADPSAKMGESKNGKRPTRKTARGRR